MQTTNKTYRVKRDMSDIIGIIPTKPKNGTQPIPIEKIISTILHKIITKKEDDLNDENPK